MPTKTIAVTAGEDVASLGWETDHWYFTPDPADTDIGWVSNDINRQGNALRFLEVPIPPGSTILYAYLKYTAFSTYVGDSVYAYIKAEKSLTPEPFTTWANYIARPRTTKKADWAEIPHWFPTAQYNSIDFTSVIQEVINQPGWTSGNPIAIFCWDEDDRSSHFNFCMRHGYAYHIKPKWAPQLHLSWLAPGDEPPPPAPGETYTIGGDTYQSVTPTATPGQTFTPHDDHILAYIDFNIDINLPVTRPYIRVYNALPDGSPDGWNISEGAYFYFPTKDKTGKWRVRVPMQPVLLVKDQLYLIEISGFLSPFEKLRWQYDKGDATYFPRGWRMLKDEATEIWTAYHNDCHIFTEFGTPPLPKAEPLPPITNFAALGIYFIHAPDYIMIFLHTNVPCHLTLYHTDKPPGKHHLSRTIRGLTVPWGVYFCFVAWQAVEQLEAGDTLWHTFVVAPWEYCQIKWFTFRGEVDNIPSPSVGPIFMHHHSGAPVVETFIARTTDGDIRTPTLIYDYILAHDGTRARVVDTSETFGIGQYTTAGQYLILRAGLFFDTSSIPNASKIISASLYFRTKYSYGWDNEFVIVSGDDLSEPLQTRHYHDLLDDTASLGSTPQIEWKTRYTINLNDLGLAKINRQGITKLALRTRRDIDTIPPAAWDHTYIYAAESRYKPSLTVTYQTS